MRNAFSPKLHCTEISIVQEVLLSNETVESEGIVDKQLLFSVELLQQVWSWLIISTADGKDKMGDENRGGEREEVGSEESEDDGKDGDTKGD